jgi:transketolase
MRFDPQDPIWPNRDRFVLSNGHASMLLWSILHLTGVRAVNAEYERLGNPSVTLDDIRRFRQLDSRAPGHPEYRWVSGVETTTGPLGQGVATSVGMGGCVIGMKTFGASAPLKELQKKFGFEPDQVAEAAKELLGRK